MTISFRQDPFDGRCLTILSQGVPSATTSADTHPADDDSGDLHIVAEELDSNGWRRVLYENNRSFPDNYTPSSFLSSLSVNIDVKIYEYFPAMVAAAKAVCLHASLIPIFFMLYYFLRNNELNPFYLIALDLVIMILGYLARELVIKHLLELQVLSNFGYASPRGRSHADDASSIILSSPANYESSKKSIDEVTDGAQKKSSPHSHQSQALMLDLNKALLVFGTVYIVSPLLRTLTRSWSEDTIIAIAVTMLIIHMAFHDYTFISRTKSSLEYWHQQRGDIGRVTRQWKRVDNSQALNAIIFSAIVLASRLNSFESVFGFIFFSVTAFAFLPFVFKYINLRFPNVFLFLICPLGVIATTFLLQVYVGMLPMIIFISVVCAVAIVGPYLLIKSLPLKKAIKGPWDIAIVNRRSVPPTPTGASGIEGGSFVVTASYTDSAFYGPIRR